MNPGSLAKGGAALGNRTARHGAKEHNRTNFASAGLARTQVRTCGRLRIRTRSNACLRLRTNKVLMKKYYEKSSTFSALPYRAILLPFTFYRLAFSPRCASSNFQSLQRQTYTQLSPARPRGPCLSLVQQFWERSKDNKYEGKGKRRND